MLLTNWLGTLKSHIKKRPIFRSRDRRDIRRRWNTAVQNRISTAEVLEDRTLLTVAAPGAVDDVTAADAGGTSYSFSVLYSSVQLGTVMNLGSIDTNDVTVVGPGAIGNLTVTNAQVDSANGTLLSATYTVTPPGGDWDVADDGVYTININGSEVSNIPSGDFAPAGLLTTFNVNIAPPNLAPSIIGAVTPNLDAGSAGDTTYSFDLTFADDSAIDVSTIDVNDVTVTGPGGPLTVDSAVPTIPGDGTPKTVSYTVTAPGGSWDFADNGLYTISMNANEVGDDDATQLFVPAGSFTGGSFNVSIPEGMIATLSGGSLEITQTSNPDTNLEISVSGAIITVTDPGNAILAPAGGTQVNPNTFTIPVAALTGTVINVTGGTGSDNLIVDTSVAAAGLRVFYEGGGGAGSDELTLTGTASSVEHSFTNANDGVVQLNGSGVDFVTYTGLEPVLDNITATDRTFTFTGAAETITLSDNAIVDNRSVIDSTLGESVAFVNPTGTLTIVTDVDGATDTIDIDGVDEDFDANLTVNPSAGDTINIGSVDIGSGDLNLDGIVNFNGVFQTTGVIDIETDGNLSFLPVASASAGAGGMILISHADINLGQITTSGDVELDAAGSITDVNGPGNNIDAVNATLKAGTGVGVGDALETAINSLEANIGGGLELNNTGGLNIGFATGIDGVTVGGPSTIVAVGAISVQEKIDASGGTLKLENTSGNFVVHTAAVIENDAANLIDIDSGGSVILADAAEITSSGTGTIDIDALNNVSLSNVNTGGEVQITATSGYIDDNTGGEAALITANTVALRAARGIGDSGDNDIDLEVNTLASSNSALNSLGTVISNTGDLDINTVDGLSGIVVNAGVIELVNSGALTISQPVTGSVDSVFDVTGTVTLSGLPELTLHGAAPAAGDRFKLIDNDGSADPVSGIFMGKPEGFEFTNFLGGTLSGFLTYFGGDGNDVEIVVEDNTPEVTLPTNGGADDYSLGIEGGNVVVRDVNTGEIVSTSPLAALTGPLVINGEDGQNDSLTLDLTDIDDTTPLQIIYNGGAGGFDTLEMTRTGALTSVEHVFDNASDGNVSFNGSGTPTIIYTGLEPVIDMITATDRTFTFTGTAEIITLSDDGQGSDGESLIDSTLGESVEFVNPTGTLTIITDGDPAADTIDIDGVDANFDANLTVNPSAVDTINVGTVDIGSGDLNLDGIVNFNGVFQTTGGVDVEADGDLTFAPGASAAAGAGGMVLFTHTDMHLGLITTTGDVDLDAMGFITDVNGPTDNIGAVNATLKAGTGIGVGDALETTITALAANSGVSDGLELFNAGTLDIGFGGTTTGVTVGGTSEIISSDSITLNELISDNGSSTVSLISLFGSLVDGSVGEAPLIMVDALELDAFGAVGDSSDDIDTNVNTLAANSVNSDVLVSNTGALEIGSVGAFIGVNAGGVVDISASSPLTVSNNVTGVGTVTLTATDSAGAGDDLTINDNVTVESTGLNVVLNAGDNFLMGTTASIVLAATTIDINVDSGNADPGVGGIANLNGILSAGISMAITVTGDTDDDRAVIDGNGGASNDGGTVDGIVSPFTFNGAGGNDEFTVDDSGDPSGDTIQVLSTVPGSGAVTGAGPGIVALGFENVEDLTLFTGSDADDITVTPNAVTTIDITGGNPTVSPGDSLTYLTPLGQTSTFNPDGLDGGTIEASGGFQDVEFDEIESLTFGGSVVVAGTAGDDILTITATGVDSGSYQINGGPVINFSGVTDFTFNGDDGDDTLVINHPAGSLFNPTGGIFYNGEGQTTSPNGDTLEINGGVATTVEHQFLNPNDGSIFYDSAGTATITYTGLEPILDTTVANNRIFSFTDGAEIITLSDDLGAVAGVSEIDSTLGESVAFLNPSGPGAELTINTEVAGGSGADAVNIEGLDAAFDANLNVNAGTDDTVTFQTNGTDIGTGDLGVTAGQIDVNQVVVTTGSVDMDATADDITFSAAGSIDAGTSDIDLTAFFNVESLVVSTTGEVRVEATGGGINDLTGNALITADRVALRVGGPGGITGIETAVNTLAASAAGGVVTIDDTGNLEIGTVDGLSGITATSSSIFLTTVGTLTVNDVVDGEAVDLRSGDTMTVSADVSASTGTLKLENTGGNFVLNSGAEIENVGAFLIDIDSAGTVDLTEGTTIYSLGTGLIDIDAAGDILLASLFTAGEVQVTSTGGAISDNTVGEAALVTAESLLLDASTDIGGVADSDIDVVVDFLAAVAGGNITISGDRDPMSVNTVNGVIGVTAGGDISLTNTEEFLLDNIVETSGLASTITVRSENYTLAVYDNVSSNGGAIDLSAQESLNLGALSSVDTTTAAAVNLSGDTGVFAQEEGGVVNAYGGLLSVFGNNVVSIANLRSIGGTVTLETPSFIFDNTAAEDALITADEVAMRAGTGVGSFTGSLDLETEVMRLAASTSIGHVIVSNTGPLEIGTVDGLVGVDTGAGRVTISTASPLTVAANVTGATTVTLTSIDAAGPGDNMTINGGGVTVESTGANVILNSGDDFTLSLGGIVRAATTIDINVDPITDASGATVDLLGNVDATQTTINGGDDADIFNILPTADSPITVNGGAPVLPGPGDVLNMDFSGLASSPFLTLGAAPGSGAFGFVAPDTEQVVDYTNIENVTTSAGAYHLVLDMFNSGFQNGGADVIDAFLDGPGTNLILDINGPNFFTGTVADILSFTVLGSTDDETLNVNETAGGLPFFTEAAPAAVPGSDGSHLNAAANFFLDNEFAGAAPFTVDDITIHYDGGLGVDTVNVNLVTDHNAAYFSDDDVVGGLGSGNIAAAAVGAPDIDLGLSFASLEGVGINGTTTGGGLHVDASSTPGTDNIEIDDVGGAGDGVSQIMANGGFTNMVFSGFNDLEVLGGSGSELIDLIALDTTTTLTQIQLDADDVFGTNAADVDTIRVRSTPAGVLTDVFILAADGDDLIQIFDAGNTVDNINAAITVDGEGGTDTLTVIDSGDATADTFEVTSTTVEGLTSAAGTDVTFADIDNLNVTGTGGNDTINVNMTTPEDLNNVVINGFNGDDDFNLQNDTPVGVDTRLNGDAGLDDFIFLASNVLRGFIDGGGDRDTIDYSGYTPVVHVALSGLGAIDGFEGRENNGSILGTGIASLGFTNIDNLLGSAGSDTLEGPDLNNYWGITSNDAGRLIADRTNLLIGRPTTGADTTATPPEQLIDFTSFQNLIGGNMDDRFDLSDGVGLTGSLDGSLGNDSLDYRDYTGGIVVDLFAGTATNITGGLELGGGGGDDDNSIENVFGGDGNDNIVGDNDDNILGDGFGDDFLDGGGNGVGSENGGNDVFLMEPGAGSTDVITDIHGNDTVDFRFASAGIVFDVDIINTPQDVFGGNTVELRQIQPQQPDTNPSFMENIVGSEFNDVIFIDPLSQDGNFPIDGPPVLRSADGRGGIDTLDFDSKGQEVIDTGFSLTADGVGTVQYLNFEDVVPFEDNPGFIVDNGDAAFTITGDWPFHPDGTASVANGIGFEDDIHFVPMRNLPAGNDLAEAFWEFYGLTPGDYRVSVTWPVSTNPGITGQVATDSPFTVFDGSRSGIGTTSVPITTVDLNQQNAPDDYSVDGAVWETLGVFTITDRTMTVMLNNLANGYVFADAVRIERISTGPEVQLADVTDMTAPPALVVDGHPGGINFGSTELLTPAVRTFQITNQGSALLNISNVVEPTGFSVNGLPASIPAGDTVEFEIEMDASSFGDRSGIFSFDTDDVDEATFNILLQGSVSNVVVIDDGDVGEFTATPGFESFTSSGNQGSLGYEGDVSGAIPNQPGITEQPGTETATWTFTDLADGNYRVSTTWSPHWNRAEDAPYTLDGGSGPGAPIDVDQRGFPSSFVDENGVAWFDLDASFSVTGGVLTVSLTNDASSFARDNFDFANGVIADAVRIEYLPEPDIQVTVDGGVIVADDTGVVDFGSTLPGVPVIKTFRVENLSSDPVDVQGLVEFPPGFSIDPTSPFGTVPAPPVTIPGGGNVEFTIQFDGGTTGSTFGQISFTTGDEDANPYNFTVLGEAGPSEVGITDPGFSTVGTWSGVTPGNVGDPVILYAGVYLVGGTGTNSATWEFDVEPGRYQVVAHWYSQPTVTIYGVGAASDAPFTIFDDAAIVTSIDVSQQENTNEFLDDGVFWNYIGDPVEITSNTLRVQLTDDADGLVFADEIRIYRVVDPFITVEVDGGDVVDGGTVDFEETIIGAPVTKTFTVSNLGERNMALGAVSVPPGFTLVTPPADNNLAPGASTTFTLRMEAGAAGSPSGIVRFGVDSQDSNPFNFTVSGVIQDSMIVDNGDLGYSNSGPWVVREAATIFNYFQDDSDLLPEGSGGGNTASWTFTDLGAGTYQVASTWSAHSALASNAVVTISGIEGGPFTGSLDQRFGPNDFNADGANWEELGLFQVAAGGTLTVTFDDTGADGDILADAVRLELVPIGSLAPEIEVEVGGTDLVSGAGSVDFGTAFFDESVFQTVTVTNSGTNTLTLGAISTPAGFNVSTPPGDLTLAAGQSTTFVLEFNSTGATGPYAGLVSIANDDADENPFVINVTATMTTSLIIDDGDAGFSSSGDFFNFGSPLYYGADSQRLNTGGTGTATWEFTTLPAGTYQVAATWDGHPSRDSGVDFNVASSGAGGGAASVNQQLSPADFVADGAAWEILGTVTIGAGGSITVTLTDTATATSILADAIRIERTGPLVAAGGVSNTVAPSITQSDLDSVLDAALSFWEATGLSEEQLSLLDSVSFVLSDLPDATLGLATSTTVMIDINAAGHGWFVDGTPFDSSEYSLDSDGNLVADESSDAFGRMDLLTVVMHELGHTLGLDHGDEDSLMGESLDNSERHLPEIDDFFSSMSGGDNPLLD